jgi:hypothetical protein
VFLFVLSVWHPFVGKADAGWHILTFKRQKLSRPIMRLRKWTGMRVIPASIKSYIGVKLEQDPTISNTAHHVGR